MIVLAAVLAAQAAAAPTAPPPPAPKALTLEKVSTERRPAPYAWRDATRVVWIEPGHGPGAPAALWQMDAATGGKAKLLDAPLVKGHDGKEAPLSLRGAAWTPKGDAFAVPFDHDLWLVVPGGAAPRRLTRDPEDETAPVWSPDGTRLAYARKNDLFVLEVATGAETRLTRTGSDVVLNGVLDWVYAEELAHRRGPRGFFWSPDSKAIAYLTLDQARVPTHPIVDFAPRNGAVEIQRYPKPGDANAVPSVHVVDLEGRETAAFTPSPDDAYVAPDMTWTEDAKAVCFLLLDRPQTHLTAFLLPRSGGAPRKLLEESDPAWINAITPPRFLKDGSFVFLSERSGFFHLYRHAADGSLRNPITKGSWMVDGPWTVDEAAGTVVFAATTEDPRERQVFAAKLDGSATTRLTREPGVHAAIASPGGAFFVDTFSSASAPPKSVVRSASGAVLGVLDEKDPLEGYALGRVELGSFAGADGTVFYTRLVQPPAFDPARKYPVVVYVYGGPHTQLVQNAWSGGLERYLASRGFLVWTMDNRGSWGRGHAFETPILKNMGAQELKDQLEGIAELKKRPYVDGARIGIFGWSYGGYMTLYAATHAGSTFTCAMAGAPVVDWTLYDSIYTERYMRTPQENAEGYRASSPLLAAKDLGTRLLILHGTSDDNVHLQNTIRFADALVKARKDFVFVPLPDQRHGPRGEALLYRNQRIAEWFEENLR